MGVVTVSVRMSRGSSVGRGVEKREETWCPASQERRHVRYPLTVCVLACPAAVTETGRIRARAEAASLGSARLASPGPVLMRSRGLWDATRGRQEFSASKRRKGPFLRGLAFSCGNLLFTDLHVRSTCANATLCWLLRRTESARPQTQAGGEGGQRPRVPHKTGVGEGEGRRLYLRKTSK